MIDTSDKVSNYMEISQEIIIHDNSTTTITTVLNLRDTPSIKILFSSKKTLTNGNFSRSSKSWVLEEGEDTRDCRHFYIERMKVNTIRLNYAKRARVFIRCVAPDIYSEFIN